MTRHVSVFALRPVVQIHKKDKSQAIEVVPKNTRHM